MISSPVEIVAQEFLEFYPSNSSSVQNLEFVAIVNLRVPDFFWTILVGRLSGNAWVLWNRRAALLMSGDSCGANASFGRDAFRSRGLHDDRCGIQSVTVSAIVLESVCNPSQEVPNWQLTERLILLFFAMAGNDIGVQSNYGPPCFAAAMRLSMCCRLTDQGLPYQSLRSRQTESRDGLVPGA